MANDELNLDGTKIIAVDIDKEMRKSYLDYSMSVIVGRALPDVRDGLKPVHRRILYTMYENGLTPEKAYRKSVDTVGSVLAKYHPHGDAAVYDAMVRLACLLYTSGKNAQGKTNLLESIWLCSGNKSFRGAKESQIIQFDKSLFQIQLDFSRCV